MDAWNPDQLRKMQVGGNGKLNAFFQQYGIDKATDIKVKYNNKVAEVRRTGIAEACGSECAVPLGAWAAGAARPVLGMLDAVRLLGRPA